MQPPLTTLEVAYVLAGEHRWDGSGPVRDARPGRPSSMLANSGLLHAQGRRRDEPARALRAGRRLVRAGWPREVLPREPKDALFIPKGTPYWFESVSDEPLEIMRNAATDPAITNQRVNYEALRERQQDGRHSGSVYVNPYRAALTRARLTR